jgi:hypothetical protein
VDGDFEDFPDSPPAADRRTLGVDIYFANIEEMAVKDRGSPQTIKNEIGQVNICAGGASAIADNIAVRRLVAEVVFQT